MYKKSLSTLQVIVVSVSLAMLFGCSNPTKTQTPSALVVKQQAVNLYSGNNYYYTAKPQKKTKPLASNKPHQKLKFNH